MITSVKNVASESELIIGLLLLMPILYPPKIDIDASPNTTKVNIVTAAVLETGKSHALFIPKSKKNIANNKKNRVNFRSITIKLVNFFNLFIIHSVNTLNFAVR